jgi:hypothetical protein
VPFAAKFGHTPEDLANNRALEDQLMDEYARSYGHQPTGNWILVVHPDDSSDFYPFGDPAQMWCCENKGDVRRRLSDEVQQQKT